MALILLFLLAAIVAYIFLGLEHKSLRYKIITSAIVIITGIALFYLLVIVLWNSSHSPAEERLKEKLEHESRSE